MQAGGIRLCLSLLLTVFLGISGVGNSLLGADESLNLSEDTSDTTGDTQDSSGQGDPSESTETATTADTDSESLRLFQKFARASGLKGRDVRHIVATGSFRYGKLDPKQFTLVETREGERFLELQWRFRGQDYRETLVSEKNGALWKRIAKAVVNRDGSRDWQVIFLEEIQGDQVDFREQYDHTVISNGINLRPKPLDSTQSFVISGQYAELPFWSFRSNFLLLQPFATSGKNQTGYRFIGSKPMPLVKNKEVYEVRYEGDKSFLFDPKNFLLLKWGSRGSLAGAEVEIAHHSTAFHRWNGAVFPAEIKIIADGVAVGAYTIDQVAINATYDLDLGSR